MRQSLAPDRPNYDSDQLLNIIDMIWDWYEDNGLLDIDADCADDDEVNTQALVQYVTRMLARDKGATIETPDIETLVMAELAYEQTLG